MEAVRILRQQTMFGRAAYRAFKQNCLKLCGQFCVSLLSTPHTHIPRDTDRHSV